jgi:hypothetical protein
LSEFFIHDHALHYTNRNPNQQGHTTSKPTVTNFATFLDSTTPIVRGHRQADAAYTYSKVRIGKHLCTSFPIQNGLKQ